ncbi:unnamed protein product, partial [marine sediment metagenome]
MFLKHASVLGLLILAVGFPLAVQAGPGSGTATIGPPGDVVVGTDRRWEISYTAVDIFLTGAVRLTIPAGWTAPQNGSATSAGYVAVTSSDPGATFNVSSIVGNDITIWVDTLIAGEDIRIAYGEDSIDPAGRATAPTTPGPATFFLSSHPTSRTGLQAIASQPSVSVVAGPITQLVFVTPTYEINSIEIAGPYTLEFRDQYG